MGVQAAASARFGSSASSFFLGAGMKPRTQQDMVMEKFWQDYNVMISSSSMMSPEQYRQAWDKMRDNPTYGQFMDALLLSRKSGADMDTAYAYNVFGRVPPGQLNDILKIVGIRPDLVQSFYDNKGDFTKMNIPPQDKDRLMAGAVDIAAILAMPSSANREEWALARESYRKMNTDVETRFGKDITKKISDYYAADNPSDYLDQHPEVKAALQYKDESVMNDPLLTNYYGGLDTMERYYTVQMENQLRTRYGTEVPKLEEQYYEILTSKEQYAFKKAHPILEDYWRDKKAFQDMIDRRIVALGSNLKPAPQSDLRPDGTPANLPQSQLGITPPQRTEQEWEQAVTPKVMTFIRDYWDNQKTLPQPVMKRLDYIAKDYGYYNGDELLQAILISMQ
jgi:hypothetical protein